jgi:hypothetical protein
VAGRLEQSEKSKETYAKKNGINPQTFNKWTKKKERPEFVQIPPQAVRTGITAERKAVNGLSVLIQEAMKVEPFSGDVYLFCNMGRKLLADA